MPRESHIVFLKALLAEGSLPPIYDTVSYKNDLIFQQKNNFKNTHESSIVKDIPDYFSITYNQQTNFKVKPIRMLKGHAIDLTRFPDFKTYMQKQFSSKSRSNLNRYRNRLESCFNIRYVSYYGAIDKKDYDTIFKTLKTLLVRRFEQKKEHNYELQHLEEFHTLCYDLIQQKKANLFVIYNENEPISIRINMLHHNLGYYIISGYDIDYNKFHLGSIDMLKNIEWLFQNDFKLYDLLKGYDYYKQKWATKVYYNIGHVIYNANALPQKLKTTIKVLIHNIKHHVFNTFKSLKLYAYYKKLKQKFYTVTTTYTPTIQVTVQNNIDVENGVTINFKTDPAFNYLKKNIYDFLFLNKEHEKNISVFTVKDSENQFKIQGKHASQMLIVNP